MSSSPSKPIIDPKALQNVEASATVHHEQKKAPRPKGVAQLNLTAMMDVCFQLLIFFVLTSSFALSEGILPATLPSGSGPSKDPVVPKQEITISLRSLGGPDVSIEIMNNPAAIGQDFNQLFNVLRAMEVSQGGAFTLDSPVKIQPDSTVGWGHVVNTFNAVIRAKFEDIRFAKAQN